MIENNKSIMMDHVKTEVLDLVKNIIVKLQYIADREDTVDYKRAADEYISAITMNDSFHTYTVFSKYALDKAGLTDIRYERDKFLIPEEKRSEITIYQREYVLATYQEKNNYYRMLSGLPNYGDKGIYVGYAIPDVDTSKPLHEMDDDDITVIKVTGVLSRIILENPTEKYLNYLEKERRIPIQVSRRARPFSILYIKRDRSKQGVSDMFIGMYNQCSEYVQERFYEEAYKHNSPYYDGFIGLFIISMTIQRYITNYFHKFINRDFYDKDIIKLFLESYGIPYYDEIPLPYMQKVAKNLNRLLMYKATDKVFTDIFRIFDLDNIDIYNYVLFKDVKLDAIGNPIVKYAEKTELGYLIETRTDELINTDTFCGSIKTSYNNIRNLVKFSNGKKLVFMNNGIIIFEGFAKEMFDPKDIIDRGSHIEYTAETNFIKLYKFKNISGDVYVEIVAENFEIFTVTDTKISHFSPSSLIGYDAKSLIKSMLLAKDPLTNNEALVINYENYACLYIKGSVGSYISSSYKCIHTFNNEEAKNIISLDMFDGAMTVVTKEGALLVVGKNTNNRLHLDGVIDILTRVDHILSVKLCKIFDKGTLFIINDGIVRYTGVIPEMGLVQTDFCENNILYGISGIKNISMFNDGLKDIIILHQYNDYVIVYNYKYTDKYGSLLLSANISEPECKYRFIKDICLDKDSVLMTCYKAESKISYSGKNTNRNFPFIRTMSIIEEVNSFDIEHVEIFENMMYFTANNRLYRNEISGYRQILLADSSLYIQDIVQYGDKLIVLCGNGSVFYLNDELGLNKFIYTGTNPIIGIMDGYSVLTFIDSKLNKYILNGDTITKLIDNNSIVVIDKKNDVEVSIIKIHNITYIQYSITANGIVTNTMTPLVNSNNIGIIDRITIIDTIVLIESNKVYLLYISDILKNNAVAVEYTDINKICSRIVKVDGEIIIYNKKGGITIFGNFKHVAKLECDILSDTIALYDSDVINVKDIAFNDTDFIKIHDDLQIVTYEPIVNEMYNLRFIETSMSTNTLGTDIVDSANYLDYELAVYDDNLWGGEGDKDAFVKEILSSEFNYVYSKYISINSKYNLTQLNFEVCYMFRMLVDLKENEKYLEFDVPYVGKVNLFDCIVGLFAITCMKFDFDGTIMDTTTKTMSVLGFNFDQDMDYITDVIDKANLYERDLNFKKEDIEIFRAPKLYKEASEVINLYLDNRDIMDNIYDYKFKAKTIQEYNAYKRIADASIITKYSTDMYRIDGVLPKTYLEYLSRKNPKLCEFVKETDPENMVQQIDILLVSLDTYLKTDKFKYLFLNVPSLSMDNIRKFIYYLVDVFKSYTVELKAINIIYHVDDKRIHNIKLILEEENFIKYFEQYDNISLEDFINYTFSGFNEFDRVKLKCTGEKDGNLPLSDYMLFNNRESFNFEKLHPIYESLKTDFMDFFEEMEEVIGYKQMMHMIHKNMLYVVREYKQAKVLNKEHFDLLMELFRNDALDMKEKEYRAGVMEFKNKLFISIIRDLRDGLFNEFDADTNIKIRDILISQNINRVLKDIIPFDIYDNLSYMESIYQQDNNINYKDKFYFIRKE